MPDDVVDDLPEQPDGFTEKYLFPAFNDHPDFSLVDEPFGSGIYGGNVVLDITLTDGSEWQITVARKGHQ